MLHGSSCVAARDKHLAGKSGLLDDCARGCGVSKSNYDDRRLLLKLFFSRRKQRKHLLAEQTAKVAGERKHDAAVLPQRDQGNGLAVEREDSVFEQAGVGGEGGGASGGSNCR